MPVAFDANEEREIVRALALAKEFNLDPIIVRREAATSSTTSRPQSPSRPFGKLPGGGWRCRTWGAVGEEAAKSMPIRITRMRQNAPKGPAALDKAGIPFAFSTGGLESHRVRAERRANGQRR
jgi:hypothetical protein